MPLYRYRCAACTEISEVLAKISAPPPAACPKCGEGPLTKTIARAAFQLKGGGWYADGYGSSGKSGTETSKSSADTSTSSSSDD